MKGHLLNQPLVDPHLIRIPRLTPLTTWCFPCRDLQAFRRQPHRALDAQILGLGAINQLLADLFQRLHFAGSQGDADFVDFLPNICQLLAICRRFCPREAGREKAPEQVRTGPSPKSFSGFW